MGKWCNKKWLDNHKKGNQKLHSHWQLAQMEQEKTLQRGAIVLPFKHLLLWVPKIALFGNFSTLCGWRPCSQGCDSLLLRTPRCTACIVPLCICSMKY